MIDIDTGDYFRWSWLWVSITRRYACLDVDVETIDVDSDRIQQCIQLESFGIATEQLLMQARLKKR
jgi:hypothetical protein